VTPYVVVVTWDEPLIDPDEQAPLEVYEISHRMKPSSQSHIDNSKLSQNWVVFPPIDHDVTVQKRAGGRNFVFKDLSPASGHQFRIRCRNCCGWGSFHPDSSGGGIVDQYTPGCPPSVPGRPQLVKTTRTSIMVEWVSSEHKNGATISGYEIAYRRVGEDPGQDPGAHLRFIFQEIDKDGEGSIGREEFMKGIKKIGFKLTPNQVKRLCDLLDGDGDGGIDFKEFVEFCENEDGDGDENKDVDAPQDNENGHLIVPLDQSYAVVPNTKLAADSIMVKSTADLTKLKKQNGSSSSFADSDKALAAIIKTELNRMSSGKVSASKSQWTVALFHALQYNAKEFSKLIVFGMYEFCIRCKNSYGWSSWSGIGGPYKLEDGLWVDEITSRR